jgi:hypothetical protein
MGKNGKTMEPANVLKANVMDNIFSRFRAVRLSMDLIFDFMACVSFPMGAYMKLH